MKKLLFTIFLFSFSFFGFLVLLHINDSVPEARAVEITMSPKVPDENNPFVTITITGLIPDTDDYGICLDTKCVDGGPLAVVDIKKDSNDEGKIILELCGAGEDRLKTGCGGGDFFHAKKTYRLAIFNPGNTSSPLETFAFNVGHAFPNEPIFSTLTPTNNDNLTVTLCGNRHPNDKASRNKIDFDFSGPGIPDDGDPDDITIPEGECKTATLGVLPTGKYNLNIRWQAEDFVLYSVGITVAEEGGSISMGKGQNISGGTEALKTTFTPACGEPDGPECPKKFKTPIGTISTDPAGFATNILSFGIGIAGGIAFILMIFGAYRLMFAGGNPDAMQQGREIITAAVAGLIVVVFAIFILRLIGFAILGLGSF